MIELLTRRAPREPTSTETALELPWRLLLSPSDLGGFAHAPSPVEHEGRTELWHSRLGARTVRGELVEVDERNRRGRMVRAVWARDFAQFPQAAQALMFMAGANSIFTGDTLLTTANPAFDEDKKMFEVLGLTGKAPHTKPLESPYQQGSFTIDKVKAPRAAAK